MFLTPDEVEWGWEATDTLNIIKAPWGTTAIAICYDSEFPLVTQTLAGNVVDVVLVPSMTEETGFTRVCGGLPRRGLWSIWRTSSSLEWSGLRPQVGR